MSEPTPYELYIRPNFVYLKDYLDSSNAFLDLLFQKTIWKDWRIRGGNGWYCSH
eukprot:m.176874 g.176874  ORF g.176874 m.176874 type:complete len:54 (+) comp39148_c0_seq33:72-233(+)